MPNRTKCIQSVSVLSCAMKVEFVNEAVVGLVSYNLGNFYHHAAEFGPTFHNTICKHLGRCRVETRPPSVLQNVPACDTSAPGWILSDGAFSWSLPRRWTALPPSNVCVIVVHDVGHALQWHTVVTGTGSSPIAPNFLFQIKRVPNFLLCAPDRTNCNPFQFSEVIFGM
jgi:hypothetical protein